MTKVNSKVGAKDYFLHDSSHPLYKVETLNGYFHIISPLGISHWYIIKGNSLQITIWGYSLYLAARWPWYFRLEICKPCGVVRTKEYVYNMTLFPSTYVWCGPCLRFCLATNLLINSRKSSHLYYICWKCFTCTNRYAF
mgnify:CR=1 FL=1